MCVPHSVSVCPGHGEAGEQFCQLFSVLPCQSVCPSVSVFMCTQAKFKEESRSASCSPCCREENSSTSCSPCCHVSLSVIQWACSCVPMPSLRRRTDPPAVLYVAVSVCPSFSECFVPRTSSSGRTVLPAVLRVAMSVCLSYSERVLVYPGQV